MITYRKATANDVRPALDFALRVFMEFDAPDFEPVYTINFKKGVMENDAYIERLLSNENLMFVALDGDKIVGMVAERNDGEILLLFVDGAYHKQGIATVLLSDMICALKLQGFDKITLESSPSAIPFYLKYGFRQRDDTESKYGFVYTPMEYIPNEIWDVLDSNGNKTGLFHERGRPMNAGDYHLCVHVWKHNGRGEWLIDKRTHKTSGDINGGKWETTGGAAIAGDDSLTAALRETKEELGLDLDPAKGVLFRHFAREGFYGHTYIMDVWVFEHDCTITDIHFDERETCEAMWATAGQIRRLLRDNEFFSDVDLYFDGMVDEWRAAK